MLRFKRLSAVTAMMNMTMATIRQRMPVGLLASRVADEEDGATAEEAISKGRSCGAFWSGIALAFYSFSIRCTCCVIASGKTVAESRRKTPAGIANGGRGLYLR